MYLIVFIDLFNFHYEHPWNKIVAEEPLLAICENINYTISTDPIEQFYLNYNKIIKHIRHRNNLNKKIEIRPLIIVRKDIFDNAPPKQKKFLSDKKVKTIIIPVFTL